MSGIGTSSGKRARSQQGFESTDEDPSLSKKQKRESVDVGEREQGSAQIDHIDAPGTDHIQDSLTGRRIYPADAVGVLRQLQGNLPVDDPFRDIQWKIKKKGDGYVGKVKIPDCISIGSLKGDPGKSPFEAEESVCFRLCQELFLSGLLDHTLFPEGEHVSQVNSGATSEERLPEASKSSSTTRRYDKKVAQFLTNSLLSTPTRLFPLVVVLNTSLDQKHAPMSILARTPFPQLHDFQVFCSGTSAVVSLQRAAPLEISQEKLFLLYRYSLRVCNAVINKPLESSLESFPFLFAPLDKFWEKANSPGRHWWQLPSVEDHIPWKHVAKAAETWATRLTAGDERITDDMLDDCIIQDRAVEFTNRHFVVKVRTDLSPLSRPEAGVREAESSSFLEYCKARRKDFQGLKDHGQPMIEVSQVPSAANNLAPTCGQTTPAQPKFLLKYLIPELCFKFMIPASTFRTALLLPSITHMLERMLLAKELNAKYFNSSLSDYHLLAALTPPVASVEYDYERLELLGDAYLKYVASTYLFVTMPKQREGALNHARGEIVSNKALHAGALEFGLPPYIQSKPLITKVWQPSIHLKADKDRAAPPLDADTSSSAMTGGDDEGKHRKGGKRKKQLNEQSIQWLGDKTVADVVEAILGAALLSGGHELAFRTTKLLRIRIPLISEWSELSRIATPTTNTGRILPHDIIQAVGEIIGYDFKLPSLLHEALTHSTAASGSANYERLEFLGDAVLDILTVSYIYEKYPRSSPGTLTLLKSAMVSNQTLAALCVVTGLHEAAQCSGDIGRAITGYAKRINTLKDQEYKRARVAGQLPGQFWLEAEPPKILSDIVEAILGAIFVTEAYDIQAVKVVFDKVFKPFYVRHVRLQTLSPHPTTTLYQLFQAEHCHAHSIRKEVDGQTIHCHVIVHENVLASGTDRASNMATRKAASAALDALAKNPGFVSRVCDCRASQSGKKAQNKTQLGYEDEVDALAVENALTMADA
ncbi:hypothetical protein BC835DRAFT_1333420 [Cytidiella melzeri]|nr:hypothetical protein BC835DRAFT_1333420 [Cytidiella melzeri]